MPRWQIIFCFAFLALSVSAQLPDLGELGDLLGGIDLGDLISAGEECDTEKLGPAADACSKAVESSRTVCPPECANLFKTYNEECSGLFNIFGLSGLLQNCGVDFNPTTTPSPVIPPNDDSSDADYAEPSLPAIDYDDDYTGPAPAADPTVTPLPISSASPTPAPASAAPTPVIPPSIPTIPAVTGFPASCDSYFASLNADDQLSCGLALADNPTECPDVCKRLYNNRPDAACLKELEAMAADFSPMPDDTTNPDEEFNNPCIAVLTGAGSRSSSVAGMVIAGLGALAALMVV